jgi:hypothetical protein
MTLYFFLFFCYVSFFYFFFFKFFKYSFYDFLFLHLISIIFWMFEETPLTHTLEKALYAAQVHMHPYLVLCRYINVSPNTHIHTSCSNRSGGWLHRDNISVWRGRRREWVWKGSTTTCFLIHIFVFYQKKKKKKKKNFLF